MHWYLHTSGGTLIAKAHDRQWLLGNCQDERYPLISYLNPYEDFHFNQLQMQGLIPELESLLLDIQDPDDRAAIEGVLSLAKRCANEQNLMLTARGY